MHPELPPGCSPKTSPANKKRTTRIEDLPHEGYHFFAFRTPETARFPSKKYAVPGFLFLRIPKEKKKRSWREPGRVGRKENPSISVPYRRMPGGL
jgi:hypothetical protein